MTQFLRTGRLGPLILGITRRQIVERIGEPDGVGCTWQRRPEDNCLLLYGDTGKANLQLDITDGKLSGIWLYFRGSDDMSSLPTWMCPETCPPRGSMTLNDFFSLADRLGLPWRIYHPLSFEDQTTLIISPSRVLLTWGHEPDEFHAAMLTAGY